ncbi:MAG: hypothetical protein AAF821_25420 [Cyanobacteria bacterium P01_D01_bin.156]
MSNCEFYAIRDDILNVLDFIYAETDCHVFEKSSEFGQELREFTSTKQLAEVFNLGLCHGKQKYSALLQLYTPSASDNFVIQKIALNPKYCSGHTFRYEASGWGLIQLYLGGISERGIHHSHTNHNSEKRAQKWESIYFDQLGSVDTWNWKQLSKVSRKIRYHIRNRLAVGKWGSRPILHSAQKLIDKEGCERLFN